MKWKDGEWKEKIEREKGNGKVKERRVRKSG